MLNHYPRAAVAFSDCPKGGRSPLYLPVLQNAGIFEIVVALITSCSHKNFMMAQQSIHPSIHPSMFISQTHTHRHYRYWKQYHLPFHTLQLCNSTRYTTSDIWNYSEFCCYIQPSQYCEYECLSVEWMAASLAFHVCLTVSCGNYLIHAACGQQQHMETDRRQ